MANDARLNILGSSPRGTAQAIFPGNLRRLSVSAGDGPRWTGQCLQPSIYLSARRGLC